MCNPQKTNTMKKIITSIFTLLIFTFSLNVFSQMELKDFQKQPKTGECYTKIPSDSTWVLIDCELGDIFKNKELKPLQYKLKNLGYDIDISDCIDKKTILAFEEEKKQKKVRARKK